jgi:hypothetical protein
VVGEGFAGPFAGDQDTPSGVSEVLVPVGFAPAQAGDESGPRVLGLDAGPGSYLSQDVLPEPSTGAIGSRYGSVF